jgi:hypothetical protein
VQFAHIFKAGSERGRKPQVCIGPGLHEVGSLASCSDQLYTQNRIYFRNEFNLLVLKKIIIII